MALCGVAACFFATSLARAGVDTPAHQVQSHVVRLAELQIDPSRLEEYKTTLREEIESSLRLTQGMVRSLVFVETDPIVLAAKAK
jgi:hypothetical protein